MGEVGAQFGNMLGLMELVAETGRSLKIDDFLADKYAGEKKK